MTKEADFEKKFDALMSALLEDPPEAELPAEEIHDCCRHKYRDPEEQAALIRRLNRIEGQIRGIRGMVEKDAYCTDILQQVSAAQSALHAFSRELLGSHIRSCVVQDIQNGKPEVVEELLAIIQKLTAR